MNLYRQQSINLDRPTIRLLQLLKGNVREPIRCNLLIAWFNQPESVIPYAALSYTWGCTEKSVKITVDNTTIKITSNLYSALRHLRLEDKDRILWIDAICINQDNVQEKIHQIRQMDAIYKAAEEVIVWLGDGTENTDFTMNSMTRLQEFRLNLGGDWRGAAKVWLHFQQSIMYKYEERSRLGMSELLERPWFRRIWILQEIANARVATVCCGKFSVSARIFAQFPDLVRTISHYKSVPFKIPGHCQSVLDIMPGLSRKESWWEKGRELHTLLVKFRHSEATDDRDMIYALLDISSDARDSDILDPKYDKSLQKVIHETISFIIHKKYSHTTHTNHDASLYEFLNWTLPMFLENLEELNSVILGIASQDGKEHLVKLLLATDGIKIDLKDNNGRTPLQRASQGGHQVIVQLLLEGSTERTKFQDSGYNRGLLLWAVGSGKEGAVRSLLEKDADLEAKYENGQTSLSLAARNGQTTIVTLLLEKGADREARAKNGQTPLSIAVEGGQMDVVNLLLRGGAKSETKDNNGQTPLSIAAKNGQADIVNLLLISGARFNIKDNNKIFNIQQIFTQCIVTLCDFLLGSLRLIQFLVRAALRIIFECEFFFGMFGCLRMVRIYGFFGFYRIFLPWAIRMCWNEVAGGGWNHRRDRDRGDWWDEMR
ncbi:ankyrin repeat and SAM domain containing protein 6 [Sclerotinia borealis F-4128]|uniref:Ankyrin repeat and SAM domain containing protein 6 n=1 Tax=Sclerotinia borealis (strain F-4128) TaxID=1432307 RepID=W9CWB3_SCLBF|nr:ankyrin repeat and SAM domain containing protein 6 [Sclerotinia borealis F-4128]